MSEGLTLEQSADRQRWCMARVPPGSEKWPQGEGVHHPYRGHCKGRGKRRVRGSWRCVDHLAEAALDMADVVAHPGFRRVEPGDLGSGMVRVVVSVVGSGEMVWVKETPEEAFHEAAEFLRAQAKNGARRSRKTARQESLL